MKKLHVTVRMLILALAGYDNNGDTSTAVRGDAPSEVIKAASSENAGSAKLSVPEKQGLVQQSAGKMLILLDLSGVQLDSAAMLVLTFSIPPDPDQDSSRAIHVVNKKNDKVDGVWELSDNLKELCLHRLGPKHDLIVTIGRGVKTLDDTTFSKDYEKTITTRDIQPSVSSISCSLLLPDKVVEELPVMALSANSVDVNFFHVKLESLPTFISQWEYRNSLANQQLDKLPQMVDLVYTGWFDLSPARSTHEKLLLSLDDIKSLQRAGVYLTVMSQTGRYGYSDPATLSTSSDIGVSAHHYHSHLDTFIRSLENNTTRRGIEIFLLDEKGLTLAQAANDAQGHMQPENDKSVALLLVHKDDRTTLFDLKPSTLDLAEFNIAGAPGYSRQFFMFGPRDLYCPDEAIILNGLLHDVDSKALPSQPIKLDVIKPNGQILRSAVS